MVVLRLSAYRLEIDIQIPTSYNSSMGTIGQPTPVTEERDNSRLIIIGAVVLVIAAMVGIAFLLREPPKKIAPPSPYIPAQVVRR
jgi:hypothetical protein